MAQSKTDASRHSKGKVDNECSSWTEYMLIHYRWVIVILFLLPMSAIYDLIYWIRAWVIFKFASAPDRHLEKIGHVQKQVAH